MTSDALLVLNALFKTIWRLFTEWKIPGTDVTPAAFLIFLLFAALALRYLKNLFSLSASVGSEFKSARADRGGSDGGSNLPAVR